MTSLLLLLILLILCNEQILSQDLSSIVKDLGNTLCTLLIRGSQLSRKTQCPTSSCTWDTWYHALKGSYSKNTYSNDSYYNNKRRRVVLSYAHNGFGNQLWQHTVAFMIAESLHAKLYFSIIPDNLCFDGVMPPNTWAGMHAMERLLPEPFQYQLIHQNHTDKLLCEEEKFYISDRPKDWRNNDYKNNFKQGLNRVLTADKPQCLKFIGYFQNLPICHDDILRLWTPRLFANYTDKPGQNDISIYLRCVPRHYHFNDRHFYETILNHTTFDRVWLFYAPECPTRLGSDPSRDGLVASVVRLLIEKFNATRWPTSTDPDDTSQLLYDLSALAQSKKLILPLSSWAQWAGMFSNATEIHVNYLLHPTMPNMPQYYYHYEKERKFFGRWNSSNNDVDFELDNPINNPGINKRLGHHYGNHHRHNTNGNHNGIHNNHGNNNHGNRMHIKNNATAISSTTKDKSVEVFYTSYPDNNNKTTILQPNQEFMNVTDNNISEMNDIIINITEKISQMNISITEKKPFNVSVLVT